MKKSTTKQTARQTAQRTPAELASLVEEIVMGADDAGIRALIALVSTVADTSDSAERQATAAYIVGRAYEGTAEHGFASLAFIRAAEVSHPSTSLAR